MNNLVILIDAAVEPVEEDVVALVADVAGVAVTLTTLNTFLGAVGVALLEGDGLRFLVDAVKRCAP